MKIKVNKKKMWLSFFLFIFLFTPPIIPNINLLYFAGGYSILVLLLSYKEYMVEVTRDKNLKRFNMLLLFVLAYYIIMMSLSIMNQTKIEISNYFVVIYRFVSIIFIIQPSCIYVWCVGRKYRLGIKDIIECLVHSAMIEFGFCLVCLLFPNVKAALTSLMIENTGYYINMQTWTIDSRFYGFAASMTDYFGLVVGIITSVCFLYAAIYKIKYMIYVPFFLIMIVLNSTTGLVIFAVSILIFSINKVISGQISKKDMIIILVAAIVIPFLVIAIKEFAPIGYQKIFDNFYEIFNPSKVKASNTSLRDLFSTRFWQFPNSFTGMIFGTGHSLLNTEYFVRSDVGYINDIWSFGIFGTIIMYIAYLRFFLQGKKNKFTRLLAYILIAAIFIFNIKGVSIGSNSGNAVAILLMLYINYGTLMTPEIILLKKKI